MTVNLIQPPGASQLAPSLGGGHRLGPTHVGQGSVPTGPAVGLVAQVVLLGALAFGVGLGVLGWLAGLTYAVLTWAVLRRGLRRAGLRVLGWANAVTLARATLVGGVTALVVDSIAGPAPIGLLTALVTVALLLDGVDGQVARRTGTSTALGARFDMEVDAFLLLALSVFVARELGGWVLFIGLFRYAFVAAAYVLPWLRAPLPPRLWRKSVAAVQGVVLAVAGAGTLPEPIATGLVALALALLCWSFGRDIHWLWRGAPAGALETSNTPVAPARIRAGVVLS